MFVCFYGRLSHFFCLNLLCVKIQIVILREFHCWIGNHYMQSLYNYYYHRGIIPIAGKGVVELVSLFFTLWLSVFLFAYLDWSKLSKCVDEESCHDSLSDYIIKKVSISFFFLLEKPVGYMNILASKYVTNIF